MEITICPARYAFGYAQERLLPEESPAGSTELCLIRNGLSSIECYGRKRASAARSPAHRGSRRPFQGREEVSRS